tara:strand:+ start:304 stop:1212 length:909 start_codon:yes stop_codon:yes gene_type:complete
MITTKNITLNKLSNILQKTFLIKKDTSKYYNLLNNKILINAFFEPSTRTSLSFESAMNRLGGKVINFNKDSSSLKKGESIIDTLKTLENYGDIMVIRHPDKNIIQNKDKLKIPIINGGNGAGEHPTQALLDFYTIYEKYNFNFENMNNLKILFIGDILDSRTVNSLVELLHLFPKMKINILPYNNQSNASNELLENINKIHNQDINNIVINKNDVDWSKYDVFYVTRMQKERKVNIDNNMNDIIIDNRNINLMKNDAMVMHPLPRNDEISPDVDHDKRIYYYKQMENGVFIRMSIILDLLEN